jgi:hypothetical protein
LLAVTEGAELLLLAPTDSLARFSEDSRFGSVSHQATQTESGTVTQTETAAEKEKEKETVSGALVRAKLLGRRVPTIEIGGAEDEVEGGGVTLESLQQQRAGPLATGTSKVERIRKEIDIRLLRYQAADLTNVCLNIS